MRRLALDPMAPDVGVGGRASRGGKGGQTDDGARFVFAAGEFVEGVS